MALQGFVAVVPLSLPISYVVKKTDYFPSLWPSPGMCQQCSISLSQAQGETLEESQTVQVQKKLKNKSHGLQKISLLLGMENLSSPSVHSSEYITELIFSLQRWSFPVGSRDPEDAPCAPTQLYAFKFQL